MRRRLASSMVADDLPFFRLTKMDMLSLRPLSTVAELSLRLMKCLGADKYVFLDPPPPPPLLCLPAGGAPPTPSPQNGCRQLQHPCDVRVQASAQHVSAAHQARPNSQSAACPSPRSVLSRHLAASKTANQKGFGTVQGAGRLRVGLGWADTILRRWSTRYLPYPDLTEKKCTKIFPKVKPLRSDSPRLIRGAQKTSHLSLIPNLSGRGGYDTEWHWDELDAGLDRLCKR